MVIIIEGIDRVGKTTLANKISEELNVPIYKQDRIGGNKLLVDNGESNTIKNYRTCNICENYMRAKTLVDFWNWPGFTQNIIMDRFHWTEAVYSLIDRGSREQYDAMKLIEKNMLQRPDNYIIIYVMPTDIKWSSRQHGKDLTKHNEEFVKLYNESKLNKCMCTLFTTDVVLNKIRGILSNGKG